MTASVDVNVKVRAGDRMKCKRRDFTKDSSLVANKKADQGTRLLLLCFYCAFPLWRKKFIFNLLKRKKSEGKGGQNVFECPEGEKNL